MSSPSSLPDKYNVHPMFLKVIPNVKSYNYFDYIETLRKEPSTERNPYFDELKPVFIFVSDGILFWLGNLIETKTMTKEDVGYVESGTYCLFSEGQAKQQFLVDPGSTLLLWFPSYQLAKNGLKILLNNHPNPTCLNSFTLRQMKVFTGWQVSTKRK